jgi:uncharacterized membrane protein
MEKVELILSETVKVVSIVLEFTAVICIAFGFVKTCGLLLQKTKKGYSPLYNRLRLSFGGWLAMALEFQLASDIIKTTISPTYEHLVQLGAIAVIRTFLNYFLSRELKELPELIEKNTAVGQNADKI